MIHLLRIEWMKVRYYRTFWVISILYLISIYGVNYITYLIQDARPKQDNMANMLIGTPPFQFPEVWHSVSYVSSFLMFIPGLLMIISFTNEYSFKTHRQNIIDGLSRRQFILVKMLLTVIVATVSTITVFLTALIFGLIEGGAIGVEKLQYVAYFFVQSLNYSAIALLFGLLFKRSGIAIGVFFLYVAVIENLLAGLLNRYVYNIGRFLPLEATDNLIPFPFLRNIVDQFRTVTSPLYLMMATVVYFAIYSFIFIKKFESDDL